jgi:hypothetical protein
VGGSGVAGAHAKSVAEWAMLQGRQLSEETRRFLEEHLTEAEMPTVLA